MQDLPILYSFRRCPYAMRARLALAYTGEQVYLREVSLKNKPPELLHISAKGTVPVLQWAGGVLQESLDIMLWALARMPSQTWYVHNTQPQLALISDNDTTFKTNLDRYKYADRYPDQPMAHYRQNCLMFMTQLEERLRGNPFLWGKQASLADYAIMPFVRQFAMVDSAWFAQQNQCPQVRTWLQMLVQDPLFGAIMHNYAPWQHGDAECVFPN